MGADALSDLLSAVHLSGSVFFDVTAQSPWVAEAPPAAQIAQEITPGADYALEYHVVTRGSCWISLLGGAKFEPVRLGEGDIAVIPRGDAHVVSSAPGMRAEPDWAVLRKAQDADALPFALRTGGDGPGDAQLICGFFTCDARPFNPLLDCLPRFIRFGRDAPGASHHLLDQFIRFAAGEMGNKRPGGQIVLNRLSELLFVEIIRWHMDQRTQNGGWLAGLRDPMVGRTLTLLHARPAHAWTLEELASRAGASRSALAERFSSLVGCAPIQYLTQWRMQLAAKRLTDPCTKISVVANEVGYDSEAAFSRAFKKLVGQSPGQWRCARGVEAQR
ncbi:helix-turn-helix domain-containing protein [Rhodoblastus acidophilus]|uniref:Helix-turn-helix domain-containing protein n=1 Tax=Rhodoblastus acidophilus TaxID=1074 RepID=A0A6N8DH93_RHOAC|nr:AraC family transcriptional regulator [Rhodoblastus acidophilus]MCW2272833.1 AraC-like DNA-binding protein [Rhodoblastus acidophilus]MTV29742.1 helix-turn-helix domain-containing protein [Rhodoblastus acidophilus]